ncbi:Desumoylating isopeptidase 1 [Yarrowia sp. B02]|nr:Desumoylating isopeptidase 1 [Yarrowia sp. B02]
MTEETHKVKLYVYDLSRGMAKQMSLAFLGTQVDGIWHTSIVIDNKIEWYYGAGIQNAPPATTHHGIPDKVVDLGETHVPEELIQEYISEIQGEYTPDKYNLFDHNCNHFTQELSQFLTGKDIPVDISSLSKNVLATPFGQMLRPMLEQGMSGVTQRQ